MTDLYKNRFWYAAKHKRNLYFKKILRDLVGICRGLESVKT